VSQFILEVEQDKLLFVDVAGSLVNEFNLLFDV